MKQSRGPGKKYSHVERMQLMNEAWRLHLRGVPISHIAERLGAARSTVQRWIASKRQEVANLSGDRENVLGEVLGQLHEVIKRAWAEAIATHNSPSARVGALRIIRDTARDIAQITGVLTEKMDIVGTLEIVVKPPGAAPDAETDD